MSIAITAFDIPGSDVQKNYGVDHKQTRATRRFLVTATSNETKEAVVTQVRTDLGTIHPHTFGTDYSGLPLQTISARKAGRGKWIVDAQYFYPF